MQEMEKVLGHEEVIKTFTECCGYGQGFPFLYFCRREGKRQKASGKDLCHDIAVRETRKRTMSAVQFL